MTKRTWLRVLLISLIAGTALAATKPSTLPQWATNPGTTIEPSGGQKAAGFAVNTKPPARWFNWYMNNVYTWMQYLDAPVGTGAGAAISGTGGSTSGPGLKGTGGAPNGDGLEGVGVGSGSGVYGVGGPTAGKGVEGQGTGGGAGGQFTGGATNGFGVIGQGVGSGAGVQGLGQISGNGGLFSGGSNGAAGVYAQGGAAAGIGVDGVGGDTSGSAAGVRGTGGAPDGPGVTGVGTGSGPGMTGTGGGSSGAIGVRGIGGATNGVGVKGDGIGTGHAVHGAGVDGHGVVAESDTSTPARAALRIVPQDSDPSSPAAGDAYIHTTSGMPSVRKAGSQWTRLVGKVCSFAGTSDTRTSTGSFANTCTIPLNTLRVGSTVRIRAAFECTAATSGNISYTVSVTGVSTSFTTTSFGADVGNAAVIEAELSFFVVGASGDAAFSYTAANHVPSSTDTIVVGSGIDATVATNADIVVTPSVTLGTATARLNSLTVDISD